MDVVPFPDPAAFLVGTAEFRGTEPVLTNVIGSVAESVNAGRTYDSYQWLAVVDDGAVVGCAIRTAPYNLVVSPMPGRAADALGRHLRDADPHPPGVSGPREVVDAVVSHLPLGAIASVTMVDLAQVLGEYVPAPDTIPGAARRAVVTDTDLLIAWMRQFSLDAGLPAHDPVASIEDGLSRGSLWLWEHDGAPVSVAGHSSLVPSAHGAVGRIGPVYTPAGLRGRGYGSAVTGAVVEALLPQASTIMLFTDATNATSNGVYARLGFRVVAELVEMSLGRPST